MKDTLVVITSFKTRYLKKKNIYLIFFCNFGFLKNGANYNNLISVQVVSFQITEEDLFLSVTHFHVVIELYFVLLGFIALGKNALPFL